MSGAWFVSPPFWAGALAAVVVAGAARWFRLLSTSGAVAACIVGAVVFGLGGGKFAVPLLVFFVTSSLWSSAGAARKEPGRRFAARGSERDWRQVAANGGAAAILVLVYAVEVRRWPLAATRELLIAYAGALAAVNADTWATEIGPLLSARPRLLSTWKPVEAGVSGAVSPAGFGAAIAGSLAIALAAALAWRTDRVEFFTIVWAGLIGSLADSVLGASLQGMWTDPETGEPREAGEGKPARGLRWLGNEAVNGAASVVAALVAWGMLTLAAPWR